jgi:hypothetical protein
VRAESGGLVDLSGLHNVVVASASERRALVLRAEPRLDDRPLGADLVDTAGSGAAIFAADLDAFTAVAADGTERGVPHLAARSPHPAPLRSRLSYASSIGQDLVAACGGLVDLAQITSLDFRLFPAETW